MPLEARLTTSLGTLVVSESGDGEDYAGVNIDLERNDGNEIYRIATVECALDDRKSENPIYPTDFHTFAYTGDSEEPVRVDFNETGEFA